MIQQRVTAIIMGAVVALAFLSQSAFASESPLQGNEAWAPLERTWSAVRVVIKQADHRLSWNLTVQRDAQTAQTFGPFSAGVPPTDLYALRSGTLIAVECNGGGLLVEVLLIDAVSGQDVETLYVQRASPSPDARFLAYERANRRIEDDHVGSVVLLYDTLKSPAQNRTPAADSFLDAGVPVFPEFFRSNALYVSLINAGFTPGQMLSKPVWIDARRFVFGYRQSGDVSLVLVSLDDHGTVSQVGQRALDPVTIMKPGERSAMRLRIEDISVLSTDVEPMVRVTFGRFDDVRVRTLDITVRWVADEHGLTRAAPYVRRDQAGPVRSGTSSAVNTPRGSTAVTSSLRRASSRAISSSR